MPRLNEKNDRAAVRLAVLLLILFAARVAAIFYYGVDGNVGGDDEGYLASGIFFARTGILSAWPQLYPYPSAEVMPGMPFVTGVFSLLFGEGHAYYLSLKLFWAFLGTCTFYFMYRTVTLYLPEGYGLLTGLFWLFPDFVWMDTVIQTETPYILFFMMAVYFTLAMGEKPDRKYFAGYAVSILGALMFRANILLMPVFTLVYLFFFRKQRKILLQRSAMLCVCLLLFIIPWSIRNYRDFGTFIPISYGTGNPELKGTRQGINCPEDDDLDYETNVYAVMRENYAWCYQEDGELKPELSQFFFSTQDKVMAHYRMREWFKQDPAAFLKSYLIIKPVTMFNWVYYWVEDDGSPVLQVLTALRKLNFVFCVLTGVLAFARKKLRGPVVFLALVYFGSIYMLSIGVALERYGSALMPLRFLINTMGIWLLVDGFRSRRRPKAA